MWHVNEKLSWHVSALKSQHCLSNVTLTLLNYVPHHEDVYGSGSIAMDWIGLAQDGNRWRAVVHSVLNLRDPYNAGILSSGLSSMLSSVVS